MAAVRHGRRRRVEGEGDPQIRRVGQPLEPGRHDAGNRVAVGVERQGLADDVRVRPEAALPQAVAQDDDVGRPRDVVLVGGEGASARGGDAQQAEVRRRDELGEDALRLVGARQRQRLVVEGGHRFEALRPVAPVGVVGIRGAPAFHARAHDVAPELDEARGIGVRQRLRPHGVDEAEDRGVAADPDRQREDGGRGEAG